MIGQTISHYRILEKIGEGGMGIVYRAHDQQLDRDVALKVLPAGTLTDEAARKQFRQEALALAKLNHPNIETIFEFGSQDGRDFFVMELIEGISLREKLKDGPLPDTEIIHLGTQFAKGLAAAHEHSIVHRDIKPENIMITPEGWLKILDFGLAKLVRAELEADLTRSIDLGTSTISGTIPYMPPEQLRGQPADPRSDIYAAGAVLYEMAAGHRPFPQTQVAEIMSAIMLLTPDLPSKHNRRVPAALDKIILKALEKEPARRYQSARELLVALEGSGAATARPTLRINAAAAALGLLLLAGLALGLNLGGLRGRLLHRGVGSAAERSVVLSPVKMRRSVAVLGFKNVSGRPDAAWLSTGLSEMLTTELAAGEQVRTVSEENVARAKQDLSLSDADSLARDTLARVRANLGSDYVVLGSYIDLGKESGGQVRVDLRLQDAQSGETIGVVQETGTQSELFELVSKAGAELRSKLGIGGVSRTDANGVRAALSSDPDAAKLYAEGLAKLRVSDALAARDILQQAVAADPQYALAHSALAAAWSALGYDAKSADEAKQAFDLSATLPREDRLAIAGRYYESVRNWPKAIDVYQTLWKFSPDNLDYGLRLAQVQSGAGQAKESLATVEALRNLPPPAADDPRIDLAEDSATRGLSDFKRELAAATSATQKGQAQGARLLVARALLAQSRAYFSLGDEASSKQTAEDARKIFAEAGDRNGEASAIHNIAAVVQEEGDNAGAEQLHEEALGTCRAIGNKRCMADALNSIAIIRKDMGDFVAAQSALEQVLAIRRETADSNGEAIAYSNIGVLHYQQGRLVAARKMFEQSLAITEKTGEKRGIVRARTNIGIILKEQGDFAAARKMDEQSIAMRREIGDKTGVGIALNNLADLLICQGDVRAAQKAIDEQMSIFQEAGVQRGLAYAHFFQGEVYLLEAKLADARKEHEEALAIRTKIGEKTTVEESRIALGILSLEEGHPADAEKPALEVRDQARAGREPEVAISAEVLLARSLLALGRTADAATEIKSAQLAAGSSENQLQKIDVAANAGRVQATIGKTADAVPLLSSTLADARKIGYVPGEFEARLALGEVEMNSGKASAGRAQLAALEKDAESINFLLIARKAHAAVGQYKSF